MEKKKVSMVKTSISHPLRIDEVKAPSGVGIIGMTLCPGKKIVSAISGVWDRDLAIDLQAIQAWGAQALVNLMEEHEYVCRLLMYTRPTSGFLIFGKAPDRSCGKFCWTAEKS